MSCLPAEHENAYNTVYNQDDGSEEHKGKLSHEVVSGRGLVDAQSFASAGHGKCTTLKWVLWQVLLDSLPCARCAA